VKSLPLEDAKALIAAGNEHLFVYSPTDNVIERWSLATFKKEASVDSPLKEVRQLLVGHSSDGPVFLFGPGEGGVTLLDGKTLKKLDRPKGEWGEIGKHTTEIRISPDGRVLGYWNSNSGSNNTCIVLTKDGARTFESPDGKYGILPGPNGTL